MTCGVTRKKPERRQTHDGSAISGADLPPVDIITFGSPCQDMSIAGMEANIEEVLTAHELYYEKSEVWIETEKMYEVLYELTV